MKIFIRVFLLIPMLLGAVSCTKLESDFAALDKQYRAAKRIQSPTSRYDYYYRYIAKGSELMAWCRNDPRNYRYTEIVRKLRAADRERSGLRQSVIEEQWRVNNVQPIVNIIYKECVYQY
ncbi:hypothetical protein WCX18_11620 [Sulfurimonas sp. HSL1-2]|uniref:hypothetical protein n=1 Tax=Thiomicrolovo zhangzhouensis TaxID=3131933 RepID=UPI0031F86BDF